MAKIVNKAPTMVLPFGVQFNRGYKAPLDLHSAFETLEAANEYLLNYSETNVYDGQLITVGKNDDVTLYIVKSTVVGDEITYRLEETGGSNKKLLTADEISAFCVEKNIAKTFFVPSDIKNGDELVYSAGLYVVNNLCEAEKLAATNATGDFSTEINAAKELAIAAQNRAVTAEANAKGYADSLAVNYDAVGAAAAAEAAAKAYADGLASNYDAAGAAATAKSEAIAQAKLDTTEALKAYYNKEEVDGLVDALNGNIDSAAATAEQNAKNYADGLAANYDAAGAAATAEQNAKDYADGLASNYDAAGAAATAEQNAKDYADTKIQPVKNVVDGIKSGTATCTIVPYAKANGSHGNYNLKISYANGNVTGVEIDYPLDGSKLIASKEYVDEQIENVLGGDDLHKTLDTLKEISSWLDNNPNDSVELTISLAELTAEHNALVGTVDDIRKDLNDLAKEVEDNEKVTATALASLADSQAVTDKNIADNYYTKSQVYTKSETDKKIQDVVNAIPEVDFTGYATETYANNAANAAEKAAKDYVDAKLTWMTI